MLAGCLKRTRKCGWESSSATQGSGRAKCSLFPLRLANKRPLVTAVSWARRENRLRRGFLAAASHREKRLSTIIEPCSSGGDAERLCAAETEHFSGRFGSCQRVRRSAAGRPPAAGPSGPRRRGEHSETHANCTFVKVLLRAKPPKVSEKAESFLPSVPPEYLKKRVLARLCHGGTTRWPPLDAR
jgi:hypothetical protein